MKGKVVFLTGGTGFVGSFLAHRLLQGGHKIIFLARNSKSESAYERVESALRFIEPDHDFRNQFAVIDGDITKWNLGINLLQLQRLKKIDEIWHCAASISFRKEEADKTYAINVDGTKNILEFAEKIEIPRLHYFSTAYVAGNRLGKVYEDELDCGQKLRNPYEQTKLEAEKLVQKCRERNGLETSIYRLSIVVGDSRTGKTPSFTGYYTFMRGFYVLQKKIYQRMKKMGGYYRKSGIVYGNGSLIIPARVPCFPQGLINIATIDYVTETICKLADQEGSKRKTFHIVNQDPPGFTWLFNTGTKILGMKGFRLTETSTFLAETNTDSILRKIESDILYACEDYLPYISGEPVFDDSNIESVLGYTPPHPPITKDLIKRLLVYAVDTEFGKHLIAAKEVSPLAISVSSLQPIALKTKAP